MLPFTDTLLPPTTDDPAAGGRQATEPKPPKYLLTGEGDSSFFPHLPPLGRLDIAGNQPLFEQEQRWFTSDPAGGRWLLHVKMSTSVARS